MKRHSALRPLETTWEDWRLGGGARSVFADPSLPLEVEIGVGDDEFLQERARLEPGTNWMGIEYSRKRVRRYVRRVQREDGEPGNLRLIWRPARDLITPFLAEAQVQRFHIYFPDPWPKAHHSRYRLLKPDFLADLAGALTPDGEIRLATDSADYAQEMLEALAETPALRSALPDPGYVEPRADQRQTVFEARWRAEGRRILSLQFVRAP